MNANKINDWADIALPKDMITNDGVYLVVRKYGCPVMGCGQWGLGITHIMASSLKFRDTVAKAMRFASEAEAERYVRKHCGLSIGADMKSKYLVLTGLPDFSSDPVWSDEIRHWTVEEITGDSGVGPLPGSFT